jgi:hypothetical protein
MKWPTFFDEVMGWFEFWAAANLLPYESKENEKLDGKFLGRDSDSPRRMGTRRR